MVTTDRIIIATEIEDVGKRKDASPVGNIERDKPRIILPKAGYGLGSQPVIILNPFIHGGQTCMKAGLYYVIQPMTPYQSSNIVPL